MLHSSLSTTSVTPWPWYIHHWSVGSGRKPSQKEEWTTADRRSFSMLCQDASVDFHSVFYTSSLLAIYSNPSRLDWAGYLASLWSLAKLLYLILFYFIFYYRILVLVFASPSHLSTILTLPKPHPSFPVSPSFLPSHLSHTSLYPPLYFPF